MSERHASLLERLVCPTCHGALQDQESELTCEECQERYPVVDRVPRFRVSDDALAESRYRQGLRGRLRSNKAVYSWVFRLLAPVLVTGPDAARRLEPAVARGVVLDLGAGNDRRHEQFVNVDILPYPEVDLIADAERLPFAGGGVSGIVSIAVLEHVQRPDRVIAEAHRILEEAGTLFLVVPFLQPFHAAPHDYRRWTLRGLAEELERDGRFRIVDRGVYCGPASALAWMLADWWALLLSFGSSRIRSLLSPLFQVMASPLKWLDVILARLPGAESVASVVYVEAQRR